MKKTLLLPVLLLLLSTSCGNLEQFSSILLNQSTGMGANENAAGLKEALSVGISQAVTGLHRQNGYFGNRLLKIALPAEANAIINNIKLVPGGQQMVDDVVLRINRAAEDAALEAKPIFAGAINNMTIADASTILFGHQSAATDYFRKNTYRQLTAAYAPKINASLGKNIVGGISAAQSWNTLSTAYNSVANSLIGKAANLQPVTNNLGEYVTQKALDGLFLTLAQEEAKIRENPAARINDLLKKVFGQLDAK